MARKSRRNTDNTAVVTTKNTGAGKIYHAALYARISSEDERKRECESMENQVKLLRDYVGSCEDIAEYDLYMDRAVTGTMFDRPEFNRMVADMRAGKFDCVIVKDLSRLGRNYLEAGNYLESIFPIFGIRFISITDHYDSLTAKASEDGLIVPLKNLINEAYAKDISKKVKSSLDAMKRQGKYTAEKLPYGYKRDPEDKHHLIVDEAVADNVARIFEEKAAGKSDIKIAAGLNDDDIPSPSRYLYENGVLRGERYKNCLWGSTTIHHILKNRIYTGDMVQGKTEKALYKGMDTTVKPVEEYIVVENTHEAIISHELFDKVQKIFERTKTEAKERKAKQELFEKPENLYDELLVCGDCGKKLGVRAKKVKAKRRATYYCYSNGSYGKKCKGKYIYKHKLDGVVETFLRQQISVYMGCVERMKEINASSERTSELKDMKKEIRQIEKKSEAISGKSRRLYADFADGILSEEDYLFAKKTYMDEQERLLEEVEAKKREAEHFEKSYSGDAEMATVYQKHYGFEVLTKEVVRDLIEKIVFYGKGRLEIRLRYEDELQAFMREIERNGGGYGE